MFLIGLVGQKGVGKDTVADYLVKNRGFQKLAFAGPLKSMCSAMYGVDIGLFHDTTLKEEKHPYWGISPRQMMQHVGTDIVRKHFGQDFWIKNMKCRLQTANGADIVISDVRFLNEAELVKQYGGVLVRIDSDNVNNDLSPTSVHISETEQLSIPADFVIHNSHKPGGMDVLYKDVGSLLEKMADYCKPPNSM